MELGYVLYINYNDMENNKKEIRYLIQPNEEGKRNCLFNGILGDIEYKKIALLMWAMEEYNKNKQRRCLVYLNKEVYLSIRFDYDNVYYDCFNVYDDVEVLDVKELVNKHLNKMKENMTMEKNIDMVNNIGKELYIDMILGEAPIYIDSSYKGEGKNDR